MILTPLLLAWSLAQFVTTPTASRGNLTNPVSFGTYRASIHDARLTLDRAVRYSGDDVDIDSAAATLRRLGTVTLPDGTLLQTDTVSRGAQLLPPRTSSTRRVASWLDSLDAGLQRVQPRAVSRSDLAQLDTVLRDSRFHPVQMPWDGLSQWISSQYHRLIRALSEALRPGKPTALIPAVLLLILLALVAVLVARGAMGKLVVERSAEDEAAAPSTAESAEERATQSAAAGNYREALRYLFLATLLQLQSHGLIELRPGMTNREYLRTLGVQGSAGARLDAPLRRLIDQFDAVWYGQQPIDEAGYAAARGESESVLAGLRERAA